MKQYFTFNWIILPLFMLAACTAAQTEPMKATRPIATTVTPTSLPLTAINISATATTVLSTAIEQPTSTSQAPALPTATPTAVPTILPSPTANIPAELQVISPENAGQLSQLAQWGNGRIDSLTWSPNGTIFAVGSTLGVDFYDSQTLQLSQTIRDEQSGGRANQVRFSPSGRFVIISLGGDLMDRFTLWDATNGQYMRDLLEAAQADFSPDGFVVYFDWAAQQLVWQNPDTGEDERALSLPYTPWTFNLISETIVELSENHTLRLYDLTSGQLRYMLDLPEIVDDIAFSPGGDVLAISGRDGFIRLWDVQSGELRHELEGQEGFLTDIIFSVNGRVLASSSGEQPIHLWDTNSGQLLHQISQQPGCSRYGIIAFSPDGREFATVNGDTIHFYDVASGALQRTLSNSYCLASDLAFSPDSRALFTAGGAVVTMLNLPDSHLGESRQLEMAVTSITISPDGQRMAYGGGVDMTWLQLRDRFANQPLYTVAEEGEPIQKAAFSPDGRLLALQSGNWPHPSIQIRDSQNGELLANYPANTLAFTPDGRFLATSTAPYAPETADIDLWETTTFQLVRQFNSLTLLTISPEGLLLASEGNGVVSWWDLESGEKLRPFSASEGPVTVHAFSPDGRLLLGTGPYIALDMWDVASGQGLWGQYAGKIGAFSPDGRYLATVSMDGIVRLWGIPISQ